MNTITREMYIQAYHDLAYMALSTDDLDINSAGIQQAITIIDTFVPKYLVEEGDARSNIETAFDTYNEPLYDFLERMEAVDSLENGGADIIHECALWLESAVLDGPRIAERMHGHEV